MGWSWANIDWTDTGIATAAWVQAVGTIGAIYFSGRLGRAQLDRQENTRKQERREANEARTQALREAAIAFQLLEKEVSGAPIPDPATPPYTVSDFTKRRFATAQMAIGYYLIAPASTPHNMASAIAAADRLLMEFELDNLEVRTPQEMAEFKDRIAGALEHMRHTLAVMDFDFLEPFPDDFEVPDGDPGED